MPLLTVLVCTYNREDLLRILLESLDQADRPTAEVEVFVVANACTDGTHALLQRRCEAPLSGQLPLRWTAELRAGKSNALNRGLSEMTAPMVAFIDDDQRVDARYLVALCDAAVAHPQADLFCGRLLPDWTGREPAWVHDTGHYRIYPLPTPNFDPGPTAQRLLAGGMLPGGGNIVARASLIRRVGPFATELGPVGHDLGGAEDADWLRRALSLGADLRYVPEMLQYHFVDPDRLTVRYLMRKAFKRSAAAIALQSNGVRAIPAHAYRKLGGYALSAMTALNQARRRFYLIRSAAALGEIAGYSEAAAATRKRVRS